MRSSLTILLFLNSFLVFSTDIDNLKKRFHEFVVSNLEGDTDKAVSLYYNGFVENVGEEYLYDGLIILDQLSKERAKNIRFEGILSISDNFFIDSLNVVKIYFNVSAEKEIGFQRYTRIALGIKTKSTDWKFICLSRDNPLFQNSSVKTQSLEDSNIRNSLYVSSKTKIRTEYYSSGEKNKEVHYFKNGDYDERRFFSFCSCMGGGKYYNKDGKKVATYAEMDGRYSITKIYYSEEGTKDSIVAYSSEYLMKTITIPVKKYDDSGRLIQHIDDDYKRINYEYAINENGKVTTMTEQTATNKVVTYYLNNKISTKKKLSIDDGSVLEKRFYDSNGLLTEYHKSTREKTKYEYNEKDLITFENKFVYVHGEWKPWATQTYLYNSKSDLIEIKRTRRSKPYYLTIYEYLE